MPNPELVERVALALIEAAGKTPHEKARAALQAHDKWLAEQGMQITKVRRVERQPFVIEE